MLEKVKSVALKVTFALSVLGSMILMFMLDRQRRKLSDLRLEADRNVLRTKLEAIQEKAQKSDKDYVLAAREYQRLRKSVPGVFERLASAAKRSDDAS